jgi:hypothetical protein
MIADSPKRRSIASPCVVLTQLRGASNIFAATKATMPNLFAVPFVVVATRLTSDLAAKNKDSVVAGHVLAVG